MVIFFAISCTNDTVNLASEVVREELIFCSPFNKEGFEGTLSIQISPTSHSYEADESFLTFLRVPEEFQYRKDSYIQIFSFNWKGSTRQFSETPHTIETFNIKSKNYSQLTSYIDHEFIRNEDSTAFQFFRDYSFKIEDTAGRQALLIGIFNVIDNPIAQVQVLIPPYSANPFIYKEEKKNEELVKLHPFFSLMDSTEEDDDNVFISKAKKACHM